MFFIEKKMVWNYKVDQKVENLLNIIFVMNIFENKYFFGPTRGSHLEKIKSCFHYSLSLPVLAVLQYIAYIQ